MASPVTPRGRRITNRTTETKTNKTMQNKKKTVQRAIREKQSLIEISTAPGDGEKVSRLLLRFAACREDDTLEEAATRLAARALTLSNIAAAHIVADADGTVTELGMGFAVEGGFLSSDIAESVIAPAFRHQELWERNLLHDASSATGKEISKVVPTSPESPRYYDALFLPSEHARRAFLRIQRQEQTDSNDRKKLSKVASGRQGAGNPGKEGQPEVDPIIKGNADHFVMMNREHTIYRELLDYRVFIADGTTATCLEERVLRSHLGRFLLHARIDSYESMARIGMTIEGFSNHRNFTRGDTTLTLMADPVLCVGAGVLDEAILRGTHRAAGFSRLLWLVESTVDCELPDTGKSTGNPNSQERDYREALKNEIRRRINFTNTDTHALPALEGCLSGWRLFLKGMEKHCPGITDASRNLPVALCYGLEAMSEHTSRVNGEEVVAFAKWLVMRMANRLAAASYQGQHGKIERLAARLAEKLATYGPLNVRELTRKCSKVKSDDCRQALDMLAERGIVAQDGDRWWFLGDPASFKGKEVRPVPKFRDHWGLLDDPSISWP